MTTVVLGWDGLDYRLAGKYGFRDSFADHHKEIESIDNPVLKKPHTYEVWPTIITGVPPENHGVQLLTQEGGARMSGSLLRGVSGAVHRYFSLKTRVRIGLLLRNRGLSLSQKSPDWYHDRGVTTVFDGRRSRSIGVPNYRVSEDRELGTVSGWDRGMSGYLELETRWESRSVVYRPSAPLERVEEWLVGEASGKLGMVKHCLARDYDLVFVWLSYLDTVGHMTPVVREGFQREAYRYAASATRDVAGCLGSNDELVVVSDHGHRGGEHTNEAFLGSSSPEVLEGVTSVLGVRDGIERVTPSRQEQKSSTGMEGRGEASAATD